jgi:glucose dehydrogenase
LAAGKLVFCTPFDRVIALDATSGHELWAFEPALPADLYPADDAICRGVSVALHCKKQRAFSPIMSNRFCTSFTARYP